MNWNDIKLNSSDTGFLYNGKDLFKSFDRAMSFHEEGIAAVKDDSGAYHIDIKGEPIYSQRYLETFGFYDGMATVRDKDGFFHINEKGQKLYGDKFVWCGNFQEGRCVIKSSLGFNHITKDGKNVSSEFYRYCGDYRYGISVVHTLDGKVYHVDIDGNRLNKKSYLDADVYHKGFAVVADSMGYFHVDKKGNSIHKYRFKKAEVFYNGWAICEEFDGRKVRINEKGEKIYLQMSDKLITINDIKDLVENGKKVALLFRHAERFVDDQVLTGNDVQLTDNGKKQSILFGEKLKNMKDIKFFSSPIPRCVNTLEHIAEGACNVEMINKTKMLGDPGCYIIPDQSDICGEAMQKNGFMSYAMSYIQNLEMPGTKNLSKASEELENYIYQNMGDGLTLFNTHDFFVSAFMRYCGVKHPTIDNYIEYFEGVVLVVDECNNKFFYHYKHEDA